MQSSVPSCEFMDPSSSQKACKATVLKRCKLFIVKKMKWNEILRKMNKYIYINNNDSSLDHKCRIFFNAKLSSSLTISFHHHFSLSLCLIFFINCDWFFFLFSFQLFIYWFAAKYSISHFCSHSKKKYSLSKLFIKKNSKVWL